jgi:hypothetical protein
MYTVHCPLVNSDFWSCRAHCGKSIHSRWAVVRNLQFQVARASQTLREALELVGEDADAVINTITKAPKRFTRDMSPVKRAFAEAVLAIEAERVLHMQRTRDEADRVQREARLGARQDEDARIFTAMTVESADVVRLNVGGVECSTSRSTLLAAPEGSPLEVLFSGRHGEPSALTFIDADPAAFAFVLGYLRAVKQGVPPIDVGVPDSLRVGVAAAALQFRLTELAVALKPAEPPTAVVTWHDVVLSGVPFIWVSCEKFKLREYLRKGYTPFGDPQLIHGMSQLMVMTDSAADMVRPCTRCARGYTERANHEEACCPPHPGQMRVVRKDGPVVAWYKWTCCERGEYKANEVFNPSKSCKPASAHQE